MATLPIVFISLSLSLSFPCFFLTSCLSHFIPCCSLHQSPTEKMSAIYALSMPNRIKHLSQAVPKSSVHLRLRIHCIVPTISSNINTLHNPQPSYNTCKHTAKTRTSDFSEIQRKKRNQLCTLLSGNKLRQSVVNHAAKTHTESQS
jgi:hypothetical protein